MNRQFDRWIVEQITRGRLEPHEEAIVFDYFVRAIEFYKRSGDEETLRLLESLFIKAYTDCKHSGTIIKKRDLAVFAGFAGVENYDEAFIKALGQLHRKFKEDKKWLKTDV